MRQKFSWLNFLFVLFLWWGPLEIEPMVSTLPLSYILSSFFFFLSFEVLIDQLDTVTGLPKGWNKPSTVPSMSSHLRGLCRSQQKSLGHLSWMGPYTEPISGHYYLNFHYSTWLLVSFPISQVGGEAKKAQPLSWSPMCSACWSLCLCISLCPHVCTPLRGIFEGLDIPECRDWWMDSSCTNVPCLSCSWPRRLFVALHFVWSVSSSWPNPSWRPRARVASCEVAGCVLPLRGMGTAAKDV